jgi:hypothetical protein
MFLACFTFTITDIATDNLSVSPSVDGLDQRGIKPSN